MSGFPRRWQHFPELGGCFSLDRAGALWWAPAARGGGFDWAGARPVDWAGLEEGLARECRGVVVALAGLWE